MDERKKIHNTNENKHTDKQTNKQTGLVTEENYQTLDLRSTNMTIKEVGGEKKTNIENLEWGGVGWGGKNLRTWRKTVRAIFKTRTENKLNQEIKELKPGYSIGNYKTLSQL